MRFLIPVPPPYCVQNCFRSHILERWLEYTLRKHFYLNVCHIMHSLNTIASKPRIAGISKADFLAVLDITGRPQSNSPSGTEGGMSTRTPFRLSRAKMDRTGLLCNSRARTAWHQSNTVS